MAEGSGMMAFRNNHKEEEDELPESVTRNSSFNWKQGRYKLDMRTNFSAVIKDKLGSRQPMWVGGAQPLHLYKNT